MPATLEQISLALDAIRNITNLRKDIKNNFSIYKAKLAAQQPVEHVASIMAEDTAQYQRRLDWHAEADVSDDIVSGLTALGVTEESYAQELVDLTIAVAELKNSPPQTAEDIIAKVDAVDATIAERKVVFKPQV